MKKLIVAVALVISTAACAGKASVVYVTADTKTVDVLSAVKNEKDVRCDAGKLPASTCRAVSAAFVPVWDAYLAANGLILAEAPLTEVDAAVSKFKVAVNDLKAVVQSVEGEAKQILLDLIEQALHKFDR